ncbi:acetyltransferase, partial [Acinetobacter baumannii]|nr:acetyltransferase [Acinetobacter baumannii]
MLTLSQKLPDYFEYIENDVSYSLRQVQYPQDIPLLHRWMHEPHVIPQWQLNKSEIELKVYFEKMLADDHQRLMIVGINGQDVGYAEIYEGKRDRLARYYKGEDNDLGWHLLFGEKSAFGQGFLRPTIRLLNFYIFENSPTNRIVG